MDISKADDIHIGSVPVQSAWLGGRKVWDRTERKIMRSMVCWYDISRQGCTNEAMAQNPVLKDLSGNGHDMSCYNFAWAGMSGIGGYKIDPSLWSAGDNAQAERNGNRIKVTYEGDQLIALSTKYGEQCVGFKVRFIGFGGKTVSLNIVASDNSRYSYPLLDQNSGDDVTVTIPQIEEVAFGTSMNAFRFLVSPKAGEGTIEFLPEYPGALVYDGVDDKTTPVPAYPKNTGTAFIVIRQIEGNRSTALYQAKTDEAESPWRNTGVITDLNVCLYGPSSTETRLVYSDEEKYGRNCVVFTWDNALPKMTAELNGRRVEAAEENLHYSYSFMVDYNDGNRPAKGALYKYILFDRTLTDAEIEWVKANLVAPPGEDYLRLSDGILLKDGSPLLLKDGSPLALERIENTD